MDIPRPFAARRRKIRHSLYLLSVIVSIATISVGLSRLEPAAPRVESDYLEAQLEAEEAEVEPERAESGDFACVP